MSLIERLKQDFSTMTIALMAAAIVLNHGAGAGRFNAEAANFPGFNRHSFGWYPCRTMGWWFDWFDHKPALGNYF